MSDCVRGGVEADAPPWPRVYRATRRDGIGEWSSAPKPHSGNRLVQPCEVAALQITVAARASTRQQAAQPVDATGPLSQSHYRPLPGQASEAWSWPEVDAKTHPAKHHRERRTGPRNNCGGERKPAGDNRWESMDTRTEKRRSEEATTARRIEVAQRLADALREMSTRLYIHNSTHGDPISGNGWAARAKGQA